MVTEEEVVVMRDWRSNTNIMTLTTASILLNLCSRIISAFELTRYLDTIASSFREIRADNINTTRMYSTISARVLPCIHSRE